MTELMVVLVLLLFFMMLMFNHIIAIHKDRVAFLEEEVKDYQDFILNLLKGR
jgi:hypothetical protein